MTTRKTIIEFPNFEALEAEAAGFIARLDHGDMTSDEISEVRAWAAQSAQHRAVLEHLAAIWGEAEILTALADYPPVEVEKKRLSVTRRYAGLAAGFALLAIGAGVFGTMSLGPKAYRGGFETAIGEQREVELPDGSKILLNTASAIDIHYSTTTREITLSRGEAFFDVAHDRNRPFRVAAGDGVVEAVGTAFSVRLNGREEVQVTVEEGRVALSSFQRASTEFATAPVEHTAPKAELLEVAANQRAVFAQSVESIESIEEAAMERALSWRKGVLIFAGDPLRDVVDEITRYTDVEIIIADPVLMKTPVGGYFRIGEIDAMLRSLEAGFGVTVDRESRDRIVLRKEV